MLLKNFIVCEAEDKATEVFVSADKKIQKEIESELQNYSSRLQECRQKDCVDPHWDTIMEVVNTVAARHFAQPREPPKKLKSCSIHITVMGCPACEGGRGRGH